MCGKRKYIFFMREPQSFHPSPQPAPSPSPPPSSHQAQFMFPIHSHTHHVIYTHRVCLNHGFSNFLDGIHHIAHKHAVTHTQTAHTRTHILPMRSASFPSVLFSGSFLSFLLCFFFFLVFWFLVRLFGYGVCVRVCVSPFLSICVRG